MPRRKPLGADCPHPETRRDQIIAFIAEYATEHHNAPSTITIAAKFGIAQGTVYGHMRLLMAEGRLVRSSSHWKIPGAVYRPPKEFINSSSARIIPFEWGLAKRGKHSITEIRDLYKSQKGKCWWCNRDLDGVFDIDHRVPIARGGTDGIENCCCACPECNSKKGDKMPWEVFARLL